MTATDRREAAKIKDASDLFGAYIDHRNWTTMTTKRYADLKQALPASTRKYMVNWSAALRARSLDLDPENDLGMR